MSYSEYKYRMSEAKRRVRQRDSDGHDSPQEATAQSLVDIASNRRVSRSGDCHVRVFTKQGDILLRL